MGKFYVHDKEGMLKAGELEGASGITAAKALIDASYFRIVGVTTIKNRTAFVTDVSSDFGVNTAVIFKNDLSFLTEIN